MKVMKKKKKDKNAYFTSKAFFVYSGYLNFCFDFLIMQKNMRNIFLEKSYTKCGGETIARPFSKKSNHLCINSLKFYMVCFIVYQVEDYQNILKLSYRLLALTVWNQSCCLIFYMIFKENDFSCYILLPVQISLSGCLYFVRYQVICVLQLFVNQVVTP